MSEKRMAEPSLRYPLPASPSLLYGNLKAGAGRFLYCHLADVYSIDEAHVLSSHQQKSSSRKRVGGGLESESYFRIACRDAVDATEARVCVLGDEDFVVVALGGRVQVWDLLCTHLLFTFVLPEARSTVARRPFRQFQVAEDTAANLLLQVEQPAKARGMVAVIAEDGSYQICVGSFWGTIFVFECKGTKFKHVTSLNEHVRPITDLASDYQGKRGLGQSAHRQMVSADDEGKMVVWAAKSSKQFAKRMVIAGDGIPCIGVVQREDYIVGALANGSVRIYHIEKESIVAEIVAHSRLLSAIDIHPTEHLIATVAEDSTISIWSFQEKPTADKTVKVVFSTAWPNHILTGVTFCGDSSDCLAVSAYDDRKLYVWTYL